jgi:DNA-binding NarL/FixJ family response regulator
MTHAVPSRRALIVDDEFLIAFDLEESMRDLGFEICDLAPTAKKAMDLAVTNQPDVVLMDVYLGGTRDGIEAGRWLREVCEASVVFVTAHSDDGTLERIREAVPGAPILSKPVYREQLARAITEAIH